MKFAAILVIQLLLCAALIWVGRFTALASLGQQVALFRETTALGDVPDDEMRPGDELVYEDATAEQIRAYTWTSPHVMTPFVGHGPEPGATGTVITNNEQCRSKRQVRMPKPADRIRIFATGGSTLWGAGASDNNHTITGYLERMLNEDPNRPEDKRYEVFAFANPAWASTHERIVIENRISEFDPDLVISFSGLNDVHWAFVGRNVLWFRSYADQVYFEVMNEVLTRTGYEPMLDVAPSSPTPLAPDLIVHRLTKNAQLATHSLSPSGIPYLFCLQPTMLVSEKPLSPRENEDLDEIEEPRQAYHRYAFDAIADRLAAVELPGFHFADLTGVFDSDRESDQVFLDPYHFGDIGNERIARRLFDLVRPILAGR